MDKRYSVKKRTHLPWREDFQQVFCGGRFSASLLCPYGQTTFWRSSLFKRSVAVLLWRKYLQQVFHCQKTITRLSMEKIPLTSLLLDLYQQIFYGQKTFKRYSVNIRPIAGVSLARKPSIGLLWRDKTFSSYSMEKGYGERICLLWREDMSSMREDMSPMK